MDLLFLKKMISGLVVSPGLLLLVLLLVVLLIAKDKKRLAMTISLLLILALYVFSSWIGEYLIVRPLENQYLPLDTGKISALNTPQTVIVVLAGGMTGGSPAGKLNAEIGKATLSRLYGGYKLYKATGLAICVSGGFAPNSGGVSLAEVMEDVLLSWEVPPEKIIVEDAARTTRENAIYATSLLQEKGYERIILVTSALHMKRSVQCFQGQGLQIIPAPCNYVFERGSVSYLDLLPNAGSLHDNFRAYHEWIGLVVDFLTKG